MANRYIGIDGGGTHSSCVLVNEEGMILRRAEGPGLNYLNDGVETCIARFREMVNRLLAVDHPESLLICAGLAALDGPAPKEIAAAFRTAIPEQAGLILQSDLSVALMGHTRGEPGLMAVCGTGSMVLLRDEAGRERTRGGWGWKLGDPGSGYMLAREGLRQAYLRHEQKGEITPMLKAALAFFQADSPREMIPLLYAEDFGTERLAAFGREVLRLAEEGDPDSLGILQAQMEEIGAIAASLLRAAPEAEERIGLYGGVFQHSGLAREMFSDALRRDFPRVRPELAACPPVIGAVIAAMREEGRTVDKVPTFREKC